MSVLDRLSGPRPPASELTAVELAELVDSGDSDELLHRLRDLTEKQRRALATPLLDHVRARARAGLKIEQITAVAVASVGCLPSPARVAAVLTRADLWRWQWESIPAAPVLRAAGDRRVDWLGEVAVRLVPKLDRPLPRGMWSFVADVLFATGTPPPLDEAFVVGWVSNVIWPMDKALQGLPTVEVLRGDPFLDPLLPRLFEVDKLGAALVTAPSRQGAQISAQRWQSITLDPIVVALAQLAAEGRLDRTVLLDGCVSRFLTGERPIDLRAFTRLHDELAPTAAEAVARAVDYARLIVRGPGPVATIAQRMLRAAYSTGGLELETLLDASRDVLARPEKGIVQTHLRWLDTIARDQPDRVDELLDVVKVAFTHPRIELQELALDIAERRRAVASPTAWADLGRAAGSLGADLRTRAAALFSLATQPTATTPVAGPSARSAVSAPMPPAIGSAYELAEEVGALYAGGLTAVALERLLDGVVRLAYHDREAVRVALEPVARRLGPALDTHGTGPGTVGFFSALGALIRAASDPSSQSEGWAAAARAPHDLERYVLSLVSRQPALSRFLVLRIAEIATRLGNPWTPFLLATPTLACGLIEPGVLTERIAAAERDGWQPHPYDLAQALLRLPRTVAEPVVSAARSLTSPAGRRLADWMTSGGLPDPISIRLDLEGPKDPPDGPYFSYRKLPRRRLLFSLASHPDYADVYQLVTIPAPSLLRDAYHGITSPTLWPAVLPAHREVVASHALGEIASAADLDVRGGAELLPVLADATGPVGPAMAAALAYGLSARHDTDRVAAVDAVLALAARGDLDARAVGDELGHLAATGCVKLNRSTVALTDIARAQAPQVTWDIVAAALEHLLAAAPVPRGLPDLLAVGARVLGTLPAGPRPRIAGLDELAGQAGSGRLLAEARRLSRMLPSG